MDLGNALLKEIVERSRAYKELAERAIQQLSDEQFFQVLCEEGNSVAIIVKHVSGNFHSRWRDFLDTDGEKPDRGRDREFEIDESDSKESLMRYWDDAWALYFETITSLSTADLSKTIYIREEAHSVVQALMRGVMHLALHVGQITLLSRTLLGKEWINQSIPRGQSEGWRPGG